MSAIDPSLAALLLLNLAAFFVGLSKGGLPAIAMLSVPTLSLVMSPLKAAALLLPIYIITDAVGVWLYRHHCSRENLRILVPAALGGVLIGWLTAAWLSDRAIGFLIGSLGIGFCLSRWLRTQSAIPPSPASPGKGLFWGTLSGFTSFVSHAGSPPFQIYVLPQKLPKLVFAGTSTLLFAAVNLAKIFPYAQLQPWSRSDLQTSLLLIPVALAGTVLGAWLTRRIPDLWFFRAVQIALFVISLRLVYAALFD